MITPTKEEILEAIQEYFGDTSRPASETKEDLEEIAEAAQGFADSIDEG